VHLECLDGRRSDAAVSRELGRARPDRVIGVHLNLLPNSAATQEPGADDLALLDPAERERTLASWQRHQEWSRERQGYADIQSTRPQTLAYALTAGGPTGLDR
jgi:epoxide hydrolase